MTCAVPKYPSCAVRDTAAINRASDGSLLFLAQRNARLVRPASRLSIKRTIRRTNGPTLSRAVMRKTSRRSSSSGNAKPAPLNPLRLHAAR